MNCLGLAVVLLGLAITGAARASRENYVLTTGAESGQKRTYRAVSCNTFIDEAGGSGETWRASPAPVHDILYARQFTLEQGSATWWEMERPTVTSGYLLVLMVDPLFLRPRAGSSPVLCGGSHTIEVIDQDYDSGLVVGILPGVADLTQTVFWHTPPGLAGEMTSGMIDAARAEAVATGIGPLDAERVYQALSEGGQVLSAASKAVLLQHATGLIAAYASGP